MMFRAWSAALAAAAGSAYVFHKRAQCENRELVAWNTNWDKLEPCPTPASDDTKRIVRDSRILYLIRHGQYTHGDSDEARALSVLGQKQARQTGARLAALIAADRPHSLTLHHSTMRRARETAEAIALALPGAPLLASDLLREGAPIRPEPDTWKPSEADVWVDGARIEAAFRAHFHRPAVRFVQAPAVAAASAGPASGTVVASSPSPVTAPAPAPHRSVDVLVCHGNVIRYCFMRALQLPPEAWLRLSVANGSITKVVIRASGSVSVETLGDTGHFEPSDITFN